MSVWRIYIDTAFSSYSELESRGVVAVGWPGLGDLSYLSGLPRNPFEAQIRRIYPSGFGFDQLPRIMHYLIIELNPGDLVIGYENTMVKGICEICKECRYFYYDNDKHTPYYEYAHCIYPVKWVPVKDISYKFSIKNAKRAFLGMEKKNDQESEFQGAWDDYKTKTGFNPCF